MARTHLADYFQTESLTAARASLEPLQQTLERALELAPEHAGALRLSFDLYRNPKQLHYNPNRAYDLGRRLLDVRPDDAGFALAFAEWLAGEVRFTVTAEGRVPRDSRFGLERALLHLTALLQKVPSHSAEEKRAQFQAGTVLLQLGRFQDAIHSFQRFLDCPPDSAIRPCQISVSDRINGLRELGTSYFKLGSYSEAAGTYASALRIQPSLVDLWLFQLASGQSGSKEVSEDQFPLKPETFNRARPPQLKFTALGAQMGVHKLDGNGPVSWGDYDGDGDEDLLAAGSDRFIALYQNEGNRFQDVTAVSGLSGVPSGYSLNFVDYDNDGDLDIYISANGWSGPELNRLFQNSGSSSFREVKAGVEDAGSGFVSLWGDFDNDGLLDLLVANGVLKDGSTPQLYRNGGRGTFLNVSRQAGLSEPPEYGTIGAALGDYDQDGDLDIFLNGWNPAPNRLYRNDGNFSFTEVAAEAGLLQPVHRGFVSFFFDYNNDGYPDILTCSLAPFEEVLHGLTTFFKVEDPTRISANAPRLFRNNRNGSFSDVTLAAGLHQPMGIMAGGIADLDNDGYLDLYFGTGDPAISRLEPNRFFRNNGDGTFSDLTLYTELGHLGKGHGIVFSDFDKDGDLDIYAQIGGFYPADLGENELYRNEWGNRNNWLQIDLRGSRSNRFGVGTRLVLRSGSLLLYREVQGSSGFGSTDSYRVHLGLADNARIDSLQIYWPSGQKQLFTDLEANQILKISENP